MKKALQISIAQTLFTFEEDAYKALESYLASVKDHFQATEGRDEIISDIESRIAEQLLEAKEKIITLASVERVLAVMGRVEDFGDEESSPKHEETPPAAQSTRGKKLYRNPDDIIIAGVCSGLGAYFGLDAVAVRIAFVVLTLISGFGLILYIVLWLIVPEAKTASQKLEMAGSPVTLETLSETVRERVEEIKTRNGSSFGRFIAFPFRIIGKIIQFIARLVGPVVRIFTGSILSFVAIVTLISMMVATGFLLSGSAWISNDVPLSALLPGGIQWLVILGASLAIMIPALFALFGGISLLKKKSIVSGHIWLGLLGGWFIALLISGFGFAKASGNYEEFVRTSPSFQQITSSIPLEGEFDKLEVTNGLDIEVTEGTSTALSATGRAKDMDSVKAHVENGTLVIEHVSEPERHFCIFCFTQSPKLKLSVPILSAATISHGSTLHSSKFPEADALTFTLENGSDADIGVSLSSLTASVSHGSSLALYGSASTTAVTFENGSDGNFTITASTLTAALSHGSRLELRGSASTTMATVENGSDFEAENFTTTAAELSASHGSSAQIGASKSLNAKAENGSDILYGGNPTVSRQNDSGSDIRRADGEDTPPEKNVPAEPITPKAPVMP